jgi:cob(I)alamin adenosyltransferase
MPEHFKLSKGYIQVYTGDGKGKTTAALGLALRAIGNGLKVYIGQFMKGQSYGELKFSHQFNDHFVIEQFGLPTFIHVEHPTKKDVELAEKGLKKIEQVLQSQQFEIVILDEINVAIYFKLIQIEDVLQILEKKPEQIEIICTGRKAPKQLIQKSVLVTEMKEIKHYYTRDVKARKGIEM